MRKCSIYKVNIQFLSSFSRTFHQGTNHAHEFQYFGIHMYGTRNLYPLVAVDEVIELLSCLGVILELSEESGGDGASASLLYTPHDHAHVTVKLGDS
jgi:hypothetical protein